MPGFPLFAVQMRTEVLADLKGGTQAQLDARSGEIRVERVIVDADVVALDEFVDDSPASHQVMQRVRINCRPPHGSDEARSGDTSGFNCNRRLAFRTTHNARGPYVPVANCTAVPKRSP